MNIENNNLKKFKLIIEAITRQILVIFMYIALTIILQLIFEKAILNNNLYIANIANILVEIILLTVFILLFRETLIPDFDDFKKNGKEYIKNYYKYWLIALFIMIVSNIIINAFLGMPTNEELNRDYLSKLPIYTILATVVFAPIIEELMTRVILKDVFKHKIIYYFLSGLIFGSLHLLSAESVWEIFYLIPYGALGFSFAVIYNKSNNVWTNIFFHSLHNTIAILLLFLGSW